MRIDVVPTNNADSKFSRVIVLFGRKKNNKNEIGNGYTNKINSEKYSNLHMALYGVDKIIMYTCFLPINISYDIIAC